MRFLHTADWHVGKRLRGRSRLDEQQAVLAEILAIARDRKIDCVLVAGDLFDSQAPAPDAERLVYDFFSELLGRGIPAVAIAGNHDHPKRLEALRQLLDRLRIYVRAAPARPEQGGLIELEANGERARIAVLPFVPENRIVDACALLGPEEEWYAAYADRVAQMCGRLAESFDPGAANLLMLHAHVMGAETSGSERAVHIALPYAVTPQRLPATAHYIALGHLHRPQEIAAPSPCAYAGSPLELDFGEQGQQKRVVIVDARPGKPAVVESVPLTAGRRLRSVEGTLLELEALAGTTGSDWLRVTVHTEEPVPGIADRIREAFPEALDVRNEYPRKEGAEAAPPATELAPEAVFRAFYQAQHAAEPPDALLAMFRQLYEEALHAAD